MLFLKEASMTKKNTELESGKIKISEDVYATIVTIAALETKGIHHMMWPYVYKNVSKQL